MRNMTGDWCELELERNDTSCVADTRQPRLRDKNQPVPQNTNRMELEPRKGKTWDVLLYKNH